MPGPTNRSRSSLLLFKFPLIQVRHTKAKVLRLAFRNPRVRVCFVPESIKWFIEDQAFSRLYDFDLAPPPPLPSVPSVPAIHKNTENWDNLLTEEGREGEEPNHTTARKAGPKILSGREPSLYFVTFLCWYYCRFSTEIVLAIVNNLIVNTGDGDKPIP